MRHSPNYPVAVLPSAGQVGVKQKHCQSIKKVPWNNGTLSFYLLWILTHTHIYTQTNNQSKSNHTFNEIH